MHHNQNAFQHPEHYDKPSTIEGQHRNIETATVMPTTTYVEHERGVHQIPNNFQSYGQTQSYSQPQSRNEIPDLGIRQAGTRIPILMHLYL